MKKIYYLFFLIFAISNCFAQKFIILHTNDHHGRPLPFLVDNKTIGGLPDRSLLIDQICKNEENILLLDAGDINDGLAESNLFQAEPDILAYNLIAYDAMTLGNHEFYHSFTQLEKQRKLAHFPFLCANISRNDKKSIAKPYIIKKLKNGLKIGIIGITTNSTKYSAPISITKELSFNDEIVTTKKIVAEIKDSTDIIIALVHLGISDDPNYGSLKLAKQVDDLDLVIDGHSHTYMEKPLWIKQNDSDSIAVVQAACWGAYLGKIDLEFKNNRLILNQWQALPVTHNNLDNLSKHELTKYQEIVDLLEHYKNQTNELLGKKIAVSHSYLSMEKVRLEPCKLGSLTANALLYYYQDNCPQFAFTNGGGIRAPINKGDLIKKDIYDLLPFDNNIVLMEIEGKYIREMCEFFLKNKIGTGAYLHFSQGFLIKTTKEKTSIIIQEKELDDNKKYIIVTNSYLAKGGDSFTMLLNGKVLNESLDWQRDVMLKYIIEALHGIIE